MCVCVCACVHMLDTALGSQTVCSHLLDLGGDLPGQGLHFSVASACPSCPTPNLSSAGFGLGERTLARHCPAWSSLQKNGEQTRCWEELEEPCPWFRSLLLVGEWVGQVCLEAAAGSLQVGDGGWIQAEPRSQRCEGRAGLRRLEEGRLCRRLPAPHVHQSASDCSPATSRPPRQFPGWTLAQWSGCIPAVTVTT